MVGMRGMWIEWGSPFHAVLFMRRWYERCDFDVQRAVVVQMASLFDALNSMYDGSGHGSASTPTALGVARFKGSGRRHAVVREAIHRVRNVSQHCNIRRAVSVEQGSSRRVGGAVCG